VVVVGFCVDGCVTDDDESFFEFPSMVVIIGAVSEDERI
jgi:hypothetical protein